METKGEIKVTKGYVAPHEIKPPPKYRYYTNGEYCNPQTHFTFLYVSDRSEKGWWDDWDFEFIKKNGIEITILKIAYMRPEYDDILFLSGFTEIENYNGFKE